MTSTKLSPFEFRLFRELGPFELSGKKIVVACSGGRDSQALLHAMNRVSVKLGFKVLVAHVNHGPNEARDQAENQVREEAKRLHLRVSTARYRGQVELRSESELRAFRRAMLEKIRLETKASYIAFAHHADDLFETRMIRLVRGTGPQGLAAMRVQTGQILRPLLKETRKSIADYVMDSQIHWAEDPTNSGSDPLRNWMRNEWLPDLEAKRPGSCFAMARSLEALLESHREIDFIILRESEGFGFDRRAFRALSESEKREALAKLLRLANVPSFGKSHLDEVCKRLATQQKQFTFVILKHWFKVNAQHVMLSVDSHSPTAATK